MSDAELLGRSALEQAALVREGEVSASELTDLYLRRIESHDRSLRAFIQVLERRARRRARIKDSKRRSRTAERAIFSGVPTGIKDLERVRGTFMRVGSRAYRMVWTPADGPEARSFRQAGFVFLGKLATSEFALMPVVETDLQASTVNPWNPEHTSGGSSGGSASAVAGGLLPIAHATDGAGSIRIPAAFCHLFGFKPSRELLPNYYARFEPLALSTSGSVAHTVDDAAAVLDVLAGRWQWPPPPDSLLTAAARPHGRNLKIKVCVASPNTPVEPEIAEAVRRVAKHLEQEGHSIEEVPAPQVHIDAFLPVFQRQACLPPVLDENTLQPISKWLRAAGRSVTGHEARTIKETLEREVLEWFGDADLMLSPTVGLFPSRVDETRDLPPEEGFFQLARFGAFTAAFNITGQPAASIPAGVTDVGLPYGVQVIGRPRGDVELLRICKHLETVMPWRGRRSALVHEHGA